MSEQRAEIDAIRARLDQEEQDMYERMAERGATETTVRYEVWRTHLRGGPDVRIGHDLSEKRGESLLADCLADKAEGYPAARLDFYLVRATTTRERVFPPGQQP